ncbi:MAG: 16S rRNA (uracil(1498)-N(3))-methyltransferase [Caulobacterales bacterium]|nr:16S rRNA (uracil(1498)-N(3))-methyltransferase [Caulobacterales bacterium]
MANPRLLIDQTLKAGAEIALDEGQARHVGTVLRLDAGDGLRVFNARDGEWRATVSTKTKRGMSVRIEALLREARATPDLDLLFAPVKRHATDLIVEKAAELGVRRIRPIITQRTIAETVRIDRLQSIAREAAEQTERFDAPEICEPLSLARALDGWDASRPLIYADEAGDATPLLQALSIWTAGVPPANAGGPCKLAVLIGPEGGFTPEERRMLRALTHVIPVSLGPRILRAETAAIAALSVVQSAWGDWREA